MATLVLRYDSLGRTVVVSEHDDSDEAVEAAARYALEDKGTKYTVRGEQGEMIAEYTAEVKK